MRSFLSAPASFAVGSIASERFTRFKRGVQAVIGLITRVTVFIVIAVGGGLTTSWYASTHGIALNTERVGPWVRSSACRTA